ncbi:tyrosine-type recombinase/integrase [Variovorax fucosicus]|uniref:tyrosine-type recombinase/integrase n=1 Tax=Variovorax fucosicus TaxID=3053517 RepID=UPI0033653FDD
MSGPRPGLEALPSPTISAYLQCLLLIGSRRDELLALKWSDLDLNWCGITIRDKVEGGRTFPLTPYVWHLMSTLPRVNDYVFASHIEGKKTHLADPSGSLETANASAKTDGLTLHGLRRSFKSLTEWGLRHLRAWWLRSWATSHQPRRRSTAR